MSPGTPTTAGSFNLGTLTLNPTSQLDFELDTPGVIGSGVNDLLSVVGSLVLDGILNVTAGTNFAEGTYRLINYTGALTDNGLLFGVIPALFDYTVDTATANQVNLLVTAAAAQFWDGANTTPNGTIDGGTGTWDDSTTNWTSPTGNVNDVFQSSLVSTFAGTAGTATLADGFTANPRALEFQTPGYTVAASGTGNLTLNSDTAFVTASGLTTISAPVTGSGTLVKQGPGTLALTAANTYTGDTVIESGTLSVTGSIISPSGQIVVAFDPGENATLEIANTGSVSGIVVGIGGDAGSIGTARVAGGDLTSLGSLIVGNSGTGTLEVSNGGSVSNTTGFIGFLDGSVGTARISSGTWTNSDTLIVGNLGTGTSPSAAPAKSPATEPSSASTKTAVGAVTVIAADGRMRTSSSSDLKGQATFAVGGTGAVSNVVGFLGITRLSTGIA